MPGINGKGRFAGAGLVRGSASAYLVEASHFHRPGKTDCLTFFLKQMLCQELAEITKVTNW